MIPARALDGAPAPIHVVRSGPVRQRMIGAVFGTAFGCCVEVSVHAEKLLPAATKGGIRVIDLTRVFDENAVAGQVRQTRVPLAKVVIAAAGGELRIRK